jgi:predicted phage tail protein
MLILLYGHLGQRFGRRHQYAVRTPAEAMRALRANHRGFDAALREFDGGYRVMRGYDEVRRGGLQDPSGQAETLRIVPMVGGAGVGEAVTWIIAEHLAISVGAFEIIAFVVDVAVTMALSGVAQSLFAPSTSSAQERPENKPSQIFNGPVNTTAQGNPVPVCYGRLRVGSQVVSAGLSVEQIPV